MPQLKPRDIVLVDLDGERAEGRLQPSTDAPTHLALYRAFAGIGGVTHTHSPYATMFAQAGRGIPCLGTTHADHFNGEVPVTRALTRKEVAGEYEENTGRAIVERFKKLNPDEMPAVLVAHHGPFTWGRTAAESLTNSVALELVAQTALGTLQLNGAARPHPGFPPRETLPPQARAGRVLRAKKLDGIVAHHQGTKNDNGISTTDEHR